MADPFLNDGGIPYGSQVLTLLATTTATSGTTYIADNIDFTDPSKEINRTNQLDEPSGSVNYDDFQRATATLQLATTTTPLQLAGDAVDASALLLPAATTTTEARDADQAKDRIAAAVAVSA